MARKNNTGVSLNDVAKAAGVSAQTVSRVANGSDAVRPDTKERVLAAMEELGYRPSFAARSLRTGRYKSVGLAMPCDISATGRRYQLEGLANAATEQGYALTLVQMCDNELLLADASRRMESLPVDGQIIGLGIDPDDFLTYVPPATIPTVIISTRPHPRCATVSSDQIACSVDIVKYLVARGHREIRYVGGRKDAPANKGRLEGWERIMRTLGLPLSEPFFGDWTADSGYRIGSILARDERCTAIYASNDAMALGVIAALRDAGLRVPQDISVIGVDDSLVGVMPRLELSSYRFDVERVGALAFELAINPPDGADRPHTLVPGVLVERSTVAEATR